MNPLIYLASPYSNATNKNFKAVCQAAGKLMWRGHFVLSPIAHTHPIAVQGGLPTAFHFWNTYDAALISRCDELWVLMLPGWGESVGVTAEIKIARDTGKPISYVDPETCNITKDTYAN